MRRGPNPRMIAILAAASILLGGGAIYLQHSAKEEAQAELNVLQAEVPDEDQLNADLAAVQQSVSQGRQRLAHLESAVPSAAYVPTLLKEIEMLGLASSLEVTGVRPVPIMAAQVDPNAPQEAKPYQEIEIDLSCKGEYAAVQAMLEGLKKFPKIIGVRTLEMTPFTRERSSSYDYLDVRLRIRAFVFPTEAAQAQTASTTAPTPGDA